MTIALRYLVPVELVHCRADEMPDGRFCVVRVTRQIASDGDVIGYSKTQLSEPYNLKAEAMAAAIVQNTREAHAEDHR